MVAVSISNALAAQVPVPVVPGIEPANTLPASIFGQLFSAQLVAGDGAATATSSPAVPPKQDAHAKAFAGRASGARFSTGPLDPQLLVPVLPMPSPLLTDVVPPPAADVDDAAGVAGNSQGLPSAGDVAQPVKESVSSLTSGIPSDRQALAGTALQGEDPSQNLGTVQQRTLAAATPQLLSAAFAGSTQPETTSQDSAPASTGLLGSQSALSSLWQPQFDSVNPSRAVRPAATDFPFPQPESTDPQNPALSSLKPLQGARADLTFMSLQPQGYAQAQSGSFEHGLHAAPSQSVPTEDSSKLSAFVRSATVLSILTKPALANLSSPVHDSSHAPAPNGPVLSVEFGVPKTDSRDTPTGSQGNESKSSSDRSSDNAPAHSDAGFGQSLAAAGTSAVNPHMATTDMSTAPAAVVRVPTDPRPESGDQKATASEVSGPSDLAAAPTAHTVDQPVVSGAHLAESATQAEIRIEMQAGPLGAVELRAHISGDQIGASIAVEHHDAQLMLTSDLPALHSALSGKNLNVNMLHVSQGMATSTGMGHGGTAHHRAFAPIQQNAEADEHSGSATCAASVGSVDLGPGGARLSVLA